MKVFVLLYITMWWWSLKHFSWLKSPMSVGGRCEEIGGWGGGEEDWYIWDVYQLVDIPAWQTTDVLTWPAHNHPASPRPSPLPWPGWWSVEWDVSLIWLCRPEVSHDLGCCCVQWRPRQACRPGYHRAGQLVLAEQPGSWLTYSILLSQTMHYLHFLLSSPPSPSGDPPPAAGQAAEWDCEVRSVLISPAAAWQEVKGVCNYESDLPFPAWSEVPGSWSSLLVTSVYVEWSGQLSVEGRMKVEAPIHSLLTLSLPFMGGIH